MNTFLRNNKKSDILLSYLHNALVGEDLSGYLFQIINMSYIYHRAEFYAKFISDLRIPLQCIFFDVDQIKNRE